MVTVVLEHCDIDEHESFSVAYIALSSGYEDESDLYDRELERASTRASGCHTARRQLEMILRQWSTY